MEKETKLQGTCRNCNMMLMQKCYGRKWWFRLVREPLLLGMRILALWHRIDAKAYDAPNPQCKGCIRFMRNGLEEKSPLFNRLNRIIGPRFKKMTGEIVTADERAEAQRLAKERMGAPSSSDSRDRKP